MQPTRLRTEVLAGITTSFALAPECIVFALAAQVHPLMGLCGAIIICTLTAPWGGRPGMVSGAAGSMAVVIAALHFAWQQALVLHADGRMQPDGSKHHHHLHGTLLFASVTRFLEAFDPAQDPAQATLNCSRLSWSLIAQPAWRPSAMGVTFCVWGIQPFSAGP